MKTRKAAAPKKTSSEKIPSTEGTPQSAEIGAESATPAFEMKRAIATNSNLVKSIGNFDKTGSGSKPPPSGGVLKESSTPAQVLSVTKGPSVKKVVKKIVNKAKNPIPDNTSSTIAPNTSENVKKLLVESYNNEGETAVNDSGYKCEALTPDVGKSDSKSANSPISEKVLKLDVCESSNTVTKIKAEGDSIFVQNAQISKGEVPTKENDVENDYDPNSPEMEEGDTEHKEDYYNESMDEHASQDTMVENDGDIIEGNVIEAVENDEHLEGEHLGEEHVDFTAHANARKSIKELEIFIGGLDRNAVEDDVKKAFDIIGDVVEIRMRRDSTTSKNKGFAFVKFATKEKAAQALSEIKNPVICGKRCGTAPSEDNDTLFLGNICNTWTKEAIKQKLKDYGIEEVTNVTLVPDACYEGLSRGFAFIEFSCHAEAIRAFKRLQQPDAVFGHPERTVKVAFAEPLRDPDPEVMAQVKSVFIDGIPPHWDEDRVREQFKCFGDVVKVMLARNMLTAKRKDFGFVDFDTHEAALACIDAIHNTEIVDGDTKVKFKARLSNPLPKTQAVKGGMCGGFRIGRGSGTSSHYGRAMERDRLFSRGRFQHGRGFHPHGQRQIGRSNFENEKDFYDHVEHFSARQSFGRGGRRGATGLQRHNMGRPSHDASAMSSGRYFSSRRPFSSDDGGGRIFGRTLSDVFHSERNPRGLKRPIYLAEPGYPETSRFRARLNYSDSRFSSQHIDYQDTFEDVDGFYSYDYYGTEYGPGYPSSYGTERLYKDSDY